MRSTQAYVPCEAEAVPSRVLRTDAGANQGPGMARVVGFDNAAYRVLRPAEQKLGRGFTMMDSGILDR